MFNPIIHQPVRSKLVAMLIHDEKLPFSILKKKLSLTDGNLSSHIKKLQNANYIDVEKFFEGKRPKTVIAINDKGKEAFKEYIKELQRFLDEV